jgi:hypothetical protein
LRREKREEKTEEERKKERKRKKSKKSEVKINYLFLCALTGIISSLTLTIP